MDSELKALVDKWLKWDQNEKTRKEITDLVEAEKFEELRARMCGKLTFGTAGIRCRMGAGFARLNDLTVIQITHGMAKHLVDEFDEPISVLIGFDGRHNSRRDVVPTPVASFATVALNCNAGLMITASHNPKHDNGYKAYWRNGAQILAPHDAAICRAAAAEPEPCADYWRVERLAASDLYRIADEVLERYYESESSMCYYRELNAKSPLKFTYSAFHGVGTKFARRLFANYGIPEENVFHVKEHEEPDPDFPTVAFPNPEEGHRVLKLCIETADRSGSSILLANDPDADRLQLAERQKDGQWRIFTGNEMGTILTWWMWTNWRAAHPDANPADVYILNSAVSSQIVKTMADIEGFRNLTTLTGFKWMGNKADELRSAGKTVILAWEESIGFMAGNTLDKDGVSAAAIFAEIANYLHVRENGMRLSDQLFRLYERYGFHLVRSSYWIVPNADVTKQIFADLRRDRRYPTRIGEYAVQFVRDLTTGYDNSQPDNKAILPLSTSSEMLTFTLAGGSVVTLRASGTEPKVKYYIELKTPPGKTQNDIADVLSALERLEADVVQTLLNPRHYGLISRGN